MTEALIMQNAIGRSMTSTRGFGGPHAAGFTLVEMLVALVVLTVGMLGTSMLFLLGLHDSRAALLRSEAATAASDILDRIRANRTANVDYSTAQNPNPALVAACETSGSTCTDQQMASNDLYRWQQWIQSALPAGIGSVAVVAVNTTTYQYTITVTWTEVGNAQPASYTVTTQI
jgi:type IV pilus assembly protein PilV